MVLNNLISGEEFYLQEMTPKKQRVPSAKQKLSVTVPSKQKWQPLVKLRELFSTHDHTPTTSPIDELQKQQAEMGKQIEAQSETQKLLLQQQKEILDLLKIPNFLYVRPSKTTQIKKGYCFAFNSPTQRCQNQDCKFKHTCPTCQKRHPQYRHHSFNQRRQGRVTDSDLSDISDEVVHVYVSLRPHGQKFFLTLTLVVFQISVILILSAIFNFYQSVCHLGLGCICITMSLWDEISLLFIIRLRPAVLSIWLGE